jgi:hypothetical protein
MTYRLAQEYIKPLSNELLSIFYKEAHERANHQQTEIDKLNKTVNELNDIVKDLQLQIKYLAVR